MLWLRSEYQPAAWTGCVCACVSVCFLLSIFLRMGMRVCVYFCVCACMCPVLGSGQLLVLILYRVVAEVSIMESTSGLTVKKTTPGVKTASSADHIKALKAKPQSGFQSKGKSTGWFCPL